MHELGDCVAEHGVLTMVGPLRRFASRVARDQSGWTLVEMLVAASLGVFLLGIASTVFVSAIKSQPRATSRAADVQQARVTMERITRELRQGSEVPVASASQLSLITWVRSATCGGAPGAAAIPCRVTYTCSSTSCTRVEAAPTGVSPGPAETVVTGIVGPAVFSYSPSGADPAYVGVNLVFRADGGEDAITLSDGAALRNPGVPG